MSDTTQHRSRLQQVRDQLEDDIVNGRMRPGEQVQIEALMARFSVSRTPVREALQQLETSGLVVVQPKRGTFVAQVGVAQGSSRVRQQSESVEASVRDIRAVQAGSNLFSLIAGP